MAIYLSGDRLGDLGKTFLINDLRFVPDEVDRSVRSGALARSTAAARRVRVDAAAAGPALIDASRLPIGVVLGLFCGIALLTAFRARRMAARSRA